MFNSETFLYNLIQLEVMPNKTTYYPDSFYRFLVEISEKEYPQEREQVNKVIQEAVREKVLTLATKFNISIPPKIKEGTESRQGISSMVIKTVASLISLTIFQEATLKAIEKMKGIKFTDVDKNKINKIVSRQLGKIGKEKSKLAKA
jgi:hypothetical protein